MENLTKCPVCDQNILNDFLVCKDHTVSNDDFKLCKCESCGFVFTNPRPEPHQLGIYYKSEDYISHSNTSKGIVNKIYLLVRNFTLTKKFNLVNGYAKPKKLLDIGCATGMFLNVCKQKGVDVVGVEPDENAAQYARSTFGLDVQDEASLAKFDDNTFDAITMWHVLEHVPNLNQRVEEIKRLVKPGCFIFIAVPNMASFDAQFYSDKWAAYDVPRHLYHFNNATMAKLLQKHGLTLVEKLPMIFDSYYVSMLSEKYKRGKMNYLQAFLSGRKSNRLAAKNDVNYSSVIYVIKK